MESLIGKIFADKELGIKAGVVIDESKKLCIMTILSSENQKNRLYRIAVEKKSLCDADLEDYKDDVVYDLITNYLYDDIEYEKYNIPLIAPKITGVFTSMCNIINMYEYYTLQQCIDLFNQSEDIIKIYER